MSMNSNSDSGSVSTSCSHVHFKSEDVSTHESEIIVEEIEEGIVEVHLGFLKVHHVYQITFNLPHSLGKNIKFDPLDSLLVKVIETAPTDDGHRLVLEFNAQKEKIMKEKITLRSTSSDDDMLFIIFIARVLGKHKGTPSLRNGIHCLREEADDEQDSDWQGF